MFWKVMVLMVVLWALGFYFGVTLGGLIHVLPVAAVGAALIRRMSKPPNSEFGRWRSSATPRDRR